MNTTRKPPEDIDPGRSKESMANFNILIAALNQIDHAAIQYCPPTQVLGQAGRRPRMRLLSRPAGMRLSYTISARNIRYCPVGRMNRAPPMPRRHSATQSPTRQGDVAGPVLICTTQYEHITLPR